MEMNTTCCRKLPDQIVGKRIADIPGLAAHLREISTDYKKWVTPFECNVCGQRWQERYLAKGHGEIPSVCRL
jgi:hypothetical protein